MTRIAYTSFYPKVVLYWQKQDTVFYFSRTNILRLFTSGTMENIQKKHHLSKESPKYSV